jgi:ABC-type glycerol-3-phosphate transport system substrate-binding protein
MNRRIFIIVGILAIAVIAVVAVTLAGRTSRKQPSSITLSVWSPFDEGKTYQEMVKPFLDANPTIKLDYKQIEAKDAKEYEAKVVDAIASGKGPDIWLIRNDWLPKHQPKLAPFPTTLRWSTKKGVSDADALKELLTEAVVKQNTRDNQLYGLPIAIDSLGLFVNTNVVKTVRQELDEAQQDSALFDTYPSNWAEVEAWSKAITKKDNKGNLTRSGLSLGTTGNTYAPVDVYLALLSQYGGGLFAENGKEVTLHLAKVVGNETQFPGALSLDFITSFAKPSSANYAWTAGLGDPTTAFVNNKLGMMVGYSSLATDFRKLNKNFDSAVVLPLPQLKDPITPADTRTDYAAYWTHVVSKTSAHPDSAWRLIQGLSSAENLKIYHKETGKPTFDLVADSAFRQSAVDFQQLDVFTSQMPTSISSYKPEWQAVDETIQDLINQVVQLNQSSQAAIDSATDRLKKIIGP